MKEHYESLMDFISDIAKAAEEVAETENKNCNAEKYKDDDGIKTEIKSAIKENPFKIPTDKKPYISPELKPMPGNITIEDDGNHFILNEIVNGWPTSYTQHLYFEHIDKDGYKCPGVTDSQILAVLYSRFKNDPKKLNLVRQLMSV